MMNTHDMDLISDALKIIDSCKEPERNESNNLNLKEEGSVKAGRSGSFESNTYGARTCEDECETIRPHALRLEVKQSAKVVVRNETQQSQGNADEIGEPKHVTIFIYMCAKAFGIEVTFYWIPKKHVMLWFTFFLILYAWLSILHTQVVHMYNGDTLQVFEACAMYGIASSCTQKILGYLQTRMDIVALLTHIRKICRQIEAGPRADILYIRLRKTLLILKVFFVGVMSSVGVFVCIPIKKYIEDGELIPLLPIELLFVDQSTLLGYIIGNIILVLMGTLAAFGSALYGAVFIFCVLNYTLKVELIAHDFLDLNEMWTNENVIHVSCKRVYLKNICLKCEDLRRYMTTIKKIFERKFFFYFCFNYFSQIICLFEITKLNWTPGYALAQGLFTEMMFYCIMGTQTSIADDKLRAAICNSNWYTYDLYSQKMVLQLLHVSQRSNQIRLGVLGPQELRLLKVFTPITLC